MNPDESADAAFEEDGLPDIDVTEDPAPDEGQAAESQVTRAKEETYAS